jgi:polysaccharide biosynthesis/export protein
MRYLSIPSIVIAAVVSAGAVAPYQVSATAAPAAGTEPDKKPAPQAPPEPGEYRISSGDKLRIEVYKDTQLSQSVQVRPDGKITLPLIGDVAAAGRTSIELRDSLTTALKEYVTNPVVTVIVQEAVAAQVHVIGEVLSPGTQVMTGGTTVLQALARAGGPREFADRRKMRILRVNGTRTETIPFDYRKALKGEIEPVYLQPGDTIVVP